MSGWQNDVLYLWSVEADMRKQLQGDAAGRLQLELRWLSVVESVDNEINTVAIAIIVD